MSDNPEEERPPVATSPARVREAKRRAAREAIEGDEFWIGALSSVVGRREFWQLLRDDCHGFAPPFACGPNGFPQPEATWYQAGAYAIGQRLYQRWLRLSPDNIRLMHEENDPVFSAHRDLKAGRTEPT